jgi:hypothetical protein
VNGNQIVIFRKFDEPKVVFNGNFNTKDITAFIQANILPTVFDLTEEYSEIIFSGKKNALFLFRDEKNAD